ncbi:MAG: hypothetical protein DRP58_11135 [Spirochaetes bacterium]|nr:MAG: hypothetical protein DRP58_11135 [Spirochaetota bacterium]
MVDEIELLTRRLKREKNIRQQAEKIAEEKSRELYLSGIELQDALDAEEKARKKAEQLYQQVEYLSRIDPLTDLDNRRSFKIDSLRLFQLAIRHESKLSCAMLDIDFFKKVNDTYGHDMGDKVLIELAKTCKKMIRKTDLLARFGGEEFCFLFPETDLNHAALLADRIRDAISKLEFNSGKNKFSITVSIGISELLNKNDNIENMIKRSDDAMYKAKENGRNRVVVWEEK